jgi:hypothetical protein
MSEVGVEIVKTEETEKNEIKYLNINVSNSEVERKPDIVRLCADAGILEYVKPKIGHWIPVSERLPDKYDEYLVTKTTRDAEIEKGYHRFTYVEVMRYTRHSHWGLKTCGVVAWMPLPEPYKAESENEE